MAMKDYSEESKVDAVALYESTPGATYKGIAGDLGVSCGTLRAWVLDAQERHGVDPAVSSARRRPPARVPRGLDPAQSHGQLKPLKRRYPRHGPLACTGLCRGGTASGNQPV